MNDTKLPDTFCKQIVTACNKTIQEATSCNIVGLPGMGISYLLRHLSDTLPYHFIHLNTYELDNMTKEEILSQLARKISAESPKLADIQSKLREISVLYPRVVIIINRLDRLEGQLVQSFFDNIRFLRDANRHKIVFLSVSAQPILELCPQAIYDGFNMFARVIYVPTYNELDFNSVLKADGSSLSNTEAIRLSGGHLSLQHTLDHCQNLDLPLADPMIELVISSIWSSLTPKQQDILKQAAKGKRNFNNSFHVYDLGIIDEYGNFFSPLFKQFIVKNLRALMPKKEKLLLKLLTRHKGSVVSREHIADYVWGKNYVVGDWAIDSLVYRLRKDLGMTSSHTIKTVKKVGFILL